MGWGVQREVTKDVAQSKGIGAVPEREFKRASRGPIGGRARHKKTVQF